MKYQINKRCTAALLLCSVLITSVWAEGKPTILQTFNSGHALFSRAIQAGHAEGLMTGSIAEHFTRTFRSSGPLWVTASVIKDLTDPTCKRLNVVYRKKEVMTPEGLTEVSFTLKLNYCLDGSPPQ